ncbi:MAG TPA: hypothetical protein P5560_05560 [Thermotogota bacterium]|nr:hypothetical protein [Thermotogota bacterium]
MQPAPDEMRIEIECDEMRFGSEEKTIEMIGNVQVRYSGTRISAPYILAQMGEGNWIEYFWAQSSPEQLVELVQEKENQRFTAEVVKAYVRKNVFFMYTLRGEYEKAKNKKGQEQTVYLVGDRSRSKTFEGIDINEVQKGYITTDPRALEREGKPQYRFQSSYIVVKEGTDIIAYDLVLYVHNIPVLPWPVFFQALDKQTQPVVSSFNYGAETGFTASLQFNYLNTEDETGKVTLESRQKGESSGSKVAIENKFVLPQNVVGTLSASQDISDDLLDRTNKLSFSVDKSFADEWFKAVKLNVFYRASRVIQDGEQVSREAAMGFSLKSFPLFQIPSGGLARLNLDISKKEVRGTRNTNSYTFPSITVSGLSWTPIQKAGKNDLEYWRAIPSLSLQLSKVSFSGTMETPEASNITNALDVYNYKSANTFDINMGGFSIYEESAWPSLSEFTSEKEASQTEYTSPSTLTWALPSEQSSWKILDTVKGQIRLDLQDQNDTYNQYVFMDSTIPFHPLGVQKGDKKEAYFSFDTGYTVYVGLWDRWIVNHEGTQVTVESTESAWRYAENVKSSMELVVPIFRPEWLLWSHSLSHDYLFVKSDGNTSALGKDAEKSLLSYTGALSIPLVQSSVSLKTSYDFKKAEDKLSDPVIQTSTKLPIRPLFTQFSLTTKSPLSISQNRFVNTEVGVSADIGPNFRTLTNDVNFIYKYLPPDYYDTTDATFTHIERLTTSHVLSISQKELQGFFETVQGGLNWLFNAGATDTGLSREPDIQSIRSTWDTTWEPKEENTLELELVSLRTRNSVEFEFTPVSTLVQAIPLSLSFDLTLKPQNQEGQRLTSLGWGFDIDLGKVAVDLGGSYSYRKILNLDFGIGIPLLNAATGIPIRNSKNWDITGNISYDWDTHKFETLKITLFKDLRTWQNQSVFEFGRRDDAFKLSKFTTQFSIKVFPEKMFKVEPMEKDVDLSIF